MHFLFAVSLFVSNFILICSFRYWADSLDQAKKATSIENTFGRSLSERTEPNEEFRLLLLYRSKSGNIFAPETLREINALEQVLYRLCRSKFCVDDLRTSCAHTHTDRQC